MFWEPEGRKNPPMAHSRCLWRTGPAARKPIITGKIPKQTWSGPKTKKMRGTTHNYDHDPRGVNPYFGCVLIAHFCYTAPKPLNLRRISSVSSTIPECGSILSSACTGHMMRWSPSSSAYSVLARRSSRSTFGSPHLQANVMQQSSLCISETFGCGKGSWLHEELKLSWGEHGDEVRGNQLVKAIKESLQSIFVGKSKRKCTDQVHLHLFSDWIV